MLLRGGTLKEKLGVYVLMCEDLSFPMSRNAEICQRATTTEADRAFRKGRLVQILSFSLRGTIQTSKA